MKAINMMERFVEDVLNSNWKDLKVSCACDMCKADVYALTLNALPARYVVSNKGQMFTRVKFMEDQFHTDILRELARAAKIVAERPLHEFPDLIQSDLD